LSILRCRGEGRNFHAKWEVGKLLVYKRGLDFVRGGEGDPKFLVRAWFDCSGVFEGASSWDVGERKEVRKGRERAQRLRRIWGGAGRTKGGSSLCRSSVRGVKTKGERKQKFQENLGKLSSGKEKGGEGRGCGPRLHEGGRGGSRGTRPGAVSGREG